VACPDRGARGDLPRRVCLCVRDRVVRCRVPSLPGPAVKLLDLFCGEGGAAMGYHRAGFEVVGVDTSAARLAEYPFECHQGDAIEYVLAHGHHFDAIHASPPCTGYTRGTAAVPDRLTRYDRLIGATRAALVYVQKPYVIENVEDAKNELREPVMLCGRMFGLAATDDDGEVVVLDRHRLFESPLLLMAPPHYPHDRTVQVAGAYSGARRDKVEARTVRHGGYVPRNLEVLRRLLGTPWMTEQGCFLSIPPEYTEYIGSQLIAHLEGAL
jgi:DNA (cytosine-5)-methyltransferase 1